MPALEYLAAAGSGLEKVEGDEQAMGNDAAVPTSTTAR
jgi:hypothetical protein